MRKAHGDAYCWFIARLLCKGPFILSKVSLRGRISPLKTKGVVVYRSEVALVCEENLRDMSGDLLLMADRLQLKNPIDMFMDTRSIIRVRAQFGGYQSLTTES